MQTCPRTPGDEAGAQVLGAKHQVSPFNAPTQLRTIPASFLCCWGMAETTWQVSAKGNKTHKISVRPCQPMPESDIQRCCTGTQWLGELQPPPQPHCSRRKASPRGNDHFTTLTQITADPCHGDFWWEKEQRHPPTETQSPEAQGKRILHLQ